MEKCVWHTLCKNRFRKFKVFLVCFTVSWAIKWTFYARRFQHEMSWRDALETITTDPDVACKPFKLTQNLTGQKNHKNFERDHEGFYCEYHRSFGNSPISVSRNFTIIKIDSATFPEITCNFSEIYRFHDMEYEEINMVVSSTGPYEPKFSGSVGVSCFDPRTKRNWTEAHYILKRNPQIEATTGWHRLPKSAPKLNFNILGFDSASTNFFSSSLPRTWARMRSNPNGFHFQGFNTMSDYTTIHFIAILTGQRFFPSRSIGEYLENQPLEWLMRKLQKHGYVTSFIEDMQVMFPALQWFAYFRNVLGDFDTRGYSMIAENIVGLQNPCCFNVTCMKMFLELNKAQFQMYKDKPKLFFTFQKQYSHDDSTRFRAVDKDVAEYLKWFTSNPEVYNTTVLIMFTDHGHKGVSHKNFHQSVVDNRRPLLYMLFPEWFLKLFPQIKSTFIGNTKMMTTILDVHETIRHLALNITDKSMVTGVSKEGQTLLQPVVKSRTCNEAGVPTRLCGCKESWKELDASDLKTLPNTAMDVANAGEAVLAYMRKTATTPLFSHVGLSRPNRIPEELHFLFQNHVLFASDHLPKAKRKIPREMGYSPASSFSTCMDWGLEDIELMSMRRIQARKDTVLEEFELHLTLTPGPAHVHAITHAYRNMTSLVMTDFFIEEVVRLDKYSHTGKCVKSWIPSMECYCFCVDNEKSFKIKKL